jgi:hypothetical protein
MRTAVIVGIDDYAGAPLKGSVKDAENMTRVLSRHDDGRENFQVVRLTSPSAHIDRAKLSSAVHTLFAGDHEVALFYFSGHGFLRSTGGYLVTSDFRRYDEGVRMDEILQLANDSKSLNKIVILDCCHSGAFGSPALTGSHVSQLAPGVTVLTASRDTDDAIEVSGSGVFTELVVEALKGGAADLRGHVTPGSVYAYVDQALGNFGQRPIFKTNITNFVSLRSVTPRVPPDVLRQICTHFPTPRHQFPLDPECEDTFPGAVPEKVAVMKQLQKLFSVGLVVPVGEEFMYFAAMNSKPCELTALGRRYWQVVKKGFI